jgi:hypothetical protein
MSPVPVERIDVLAARTRWLERYRRSIAVPLGFVLWFVIAGQLSLLFGGDGINMLSLVVSVMPAVVCWWLVETMFAWMMATWEFEHDKLARDLGLPQARLLRPRRKK